MNYTLKELKDRVNKLIEQQGEDAHCGAWIYTKEDVCNITDDGDEVYPCEGNPCLLYTSPSPRDATLSRMPSSA